MGSRHQLVDEERLTSSDLTDPLFDVRKGIQSCTVTLTIKDLLAARSTTTSTQFIFS